ncbi:hypothetical protein BH10PLA2_BH10PLA2_19560 [soil metagenome]
MSSDIKRQVEFLVALGVGDVPHTQKSYLAHLTNVYRFMKDLNCTEELCQAGLFHSVYGTQRFQGFVLPIERRHEVRELIGERAEKLAYLNCGMARETIDREVQRGTGPYRITDRLTGEEVALNEPDFDDLCRVHLYDLLEQIARLGEWDYRRTGYRRMAERLGPVAIEAYDRVFAQEPVTQKSA